MIAGREVGGVAHVTQIAALVFFQQIPEPEQQFLDQVADFHPHQRRCHRFHHGHDLRHHMVVHGFEHLLLIGEVFVK